MKPETLQANRPARTVGLLLLSTFLVVGLPAPAQDIQVTSAVPDMADQGTLGLVVAIGGDGFAKGSKVAFFVTNTTNPGGITVKSVKYKNPKALEATIDVAPDAQTSLNFDIQVTSGSRTGKGTELFKVNVKVTGGDLTPPAAVDDLGVVDHSFNGAVLMWTNPADDGDDEGGPAASFDLRIRNATESCGPFPTAAWEVDGASWMRTDPCAVKQMSGTPGAPDTATLWTVYGLVPETPYAAALRMADDSPQGPNWSAPSEPLLLFGTPPFPPSGWIAPWTTQIVGFCPLADTTCKMSSHPRLGFEKVTGDPVILSGIGGIGGRPALSRRTGTAWSTETVPISIDTGNYMYDFGIDPGSGEESIATVLGGELRFYQHTETSGWPFDTIATGSVSRAAMGFDPTSNIPTVAYQSSTKRGGDTIRVAQKHETSWSIETVASGGGTLSRPVVFDADGNPAVAFGRLVGGVPRLAFGLRTGGSWTVESPDPQAPASPPFPAYSLDQVVAVAFDPLRGNFCVAANYKGSGEEPDYLRFCERTGVAWSCSPVAEGNSIANLSLAVDSLGTVFLAYRDLGLLTTHLIMLVRPPGALPFAFAAEYIDWNVSVGLAGDLEIGPDQVPTIVYGSSNDANGAWNRSVSFARRTQ